MKDAVDAAAHVRLQELLAERDRLVDLLCAVECRCQEIKRGLGIWDPRERVVPLQNRINYALTLGALAAGPKRLRDIAQLLERKIQQAYYIMHDLRSKGLVEHRPDKRWALRVKTVKVSEVLDEQET